MNHLNYLKSFLESLYRENQPQVSFEMIYVDNCSSDGSSEFVKQNYPQVKIIENDKILGFGENNNKGAEIAKGKYIAILNPDIVLQKNALDYLLNYAENLSYDAFLVPKLLNPDKSLQYSVRGFISPWISAMRLLTKGNDKTKNKTVQNYLCRNIDENKTQFIDWAIGAAFFLSTNLYKKLGGFDTDYFLYVEDVDLCLRSWEIGAPVIYYPKSEMIHNHLRASTKMNKKTLLHLKSQFLFFTKHGILVKSKKDNPPFVLPSDI